MRTFKKKEIRDYIRLGLAVDITTYSFDAVEQLRKAEQGFDVVGTCYANTGITGGVCQGRNTGNFYVVTRRNSTLLQIF